MASKPTEGSSEPLQFQTWVLKVSIHCEGCKRKVKKVLQSVEGVFTTSIDSQQHKVTVTGSVDAETLIRRLGKTGKHAELWPEKAEKMEKKQGKEKNKEPQNDSSKRNEESKVEDQKKEIDQIEVKTPKPKPKPKPNNNSSTKGKEGNKSNKEGSTPNDEKDKEKNGQNEESKGEDKQPENPPTGGQNQTSSTPEKKESESSNGVAEKSVSSSNGKNSKKKGKKGQKSNETENGETPNETFGSTTGLSPTPTTTVLPINYSPPRHHVFQYPSYGPPPQPVYGVSYNTAYPTNSSSYYAPAAPVSEPYAYVHPHAYGPPPPLDSYEMHQGSAAASPYSYPPPSDTFEMFSDENANGCWIM